MNRFQWIISAVAMLTAGAAAVGQTATTVRVRVVSHDAKIIGSGVGGARVYVRDPANGDVLAEGVQEGSTGDTKQIVVDPVARGAPIYDTPGAAVFTTQVMLAEPTVLEFVGEGPLGYEHAMQRATKTMLVVPGEDILGNGVLLELHGFIVELLAPTGSVSVGSEVEVRVRVRMMCGCPLEPGGLWDADRLTVNAQVYGDGQLLRQASLSYAGEPNIFAGAISLADVPSGGALMVVASDPTRANLGVSPSKTIQ